MEPFVGWEPFARGPTTGAVQAHAAYVLDLVSKHV